MTNNMINAFSPKNKSKFKLVTSAIGGVKELLRPYNIKNDDPEYGRFIDWEKVIPCYYLDVAMEKENEVSSWLASSALSAKESVLFASSPSSPIYLLETNFFSENWKNIGRASKFNCLIWSEDTELLMEISDVEMLLFSNFRIQP